MIFEKLAEFKERFKNWLKSKKKLTALENYSSAAPFKYKNNLTLIRQCMEEGFLNEKGTAFLDSILDEVEINYLDWAHRTKWLKGQMRVLAEKAEVEQAVQLNFFDFDKKLATPNIPVGMFVASQKTKGLRI